MIAVLVLLGCPKSDLDPVLRTNQLLFEADAAWEKRGTLGLPAAAAPLMAAFALSPADPRISWRLARWQVAVGLAAPDPGAARAAFAEGRERAVDCLDAQPNFAATRRAEGWAKALSDLPAARVLCGAWAALAWVRWLEVHGPEAGALDVPAIEALVDAGLATEDTVARSAAVWADGLLLSLRPDGRDLDAAAARLQEASALDRRSVARAADWLTVRVAKGELDQEGLVTALAAMKATTPEDRQVMARHGAGQ